MDLINGFLLAVISIATIIYAYLKYTFSYWKYRNVPCDEPTIPYGNAKGLGKDIHIGKFIQNLYNKYKPTGVKFFGVYMSINPTAVIMDLELIKNILVKDFNIFNDRGLYECPNHFSAFSCFFSPQIVVVFR